MEAYGVLLATQEGVDERVVRLFALLHDSQRRSDDLDPEHGPRAAHYARELCGVHFQLEEAALERLAFACRDHERGYIVNEPTIGACWDADRLDLDRVGIVPDPRLLSTPLARQLALLRPLDRQRQAQIQRP